MLSLLILAAVVLPACGGAPSSPTPSPEAAAPTATATPIPTNTPIPPTLTPSAAPTETPTPTLTPSPIPDHPLMIDVMRRQTYPGSDLVVEETLGPGSNYERYVVSYVSEGLKIYALLTVPRGDKPATGWPVIVFNHGYIPPEQYRTTERYGAYVDGFARNGYIVLKPDYRGHGRSEGEPGGAFISPDYTVDVLNAVGSVQRYPDADPERIGMWGHSLGGTLTVRAMVVTDDIRAGVIWAGVVAPIEDVWEERQAWIVNHLTATPDPGGTPGPPSEGVFARGWFDQNPAFWRAVDPVYHLEDLSGPIQLHHGTGDDSVPLAFSQDLYARLQAAGQPGELYLYEGDNHNLTNQFGTAMERSVAFFDAHVKNGSEEG